MGDETILDHTARLSQENQVAAVTLRPEDSQFPINFCESETCQCDVQLDIEKEDSMIAGKDDIGKGALLATLKLRNTGTETAYNIKVTISLGGNGDIFEIYLGDTRCTLGTCTIKIVEKETTATLDLRVRSRKTLPAQMSRISGTINTVTECASPSPQNQEMKVKVVQKWEMRPKAEKPFEQVTWDYNSAEAGIHPISLLYTISNKGPSIAVAPKVYILLPVHQLWLPNAGVNPPTLEGKACSATTLTPALKNALGAGGGTGVSLSCFPRSDATGCQVFQCATTGEMVATRGKTGREGTRGKTARIQMNFNKTAVVADKEGRTVFSVKAIVCADTSDDATKTIVCHQEGKSTVKFDYYPLSISGVIVDNWELVGGAIIGIIVIIITFLIFWRCNCFQKVRYYDNLLEGDEEEEGGEQLEMGESEKTGVEMRK